MFRNLPPVLTVVLILGALLCFVGCLGLSIRSGSFGGFYKQTEDLEQPGLP